MRHPQKGNRSWDCKFLNFIKTVFNQKIWNNFSVWRFQQILGRYLKKTATLGVTKHEGYCVYFKKRARWNPNSISTFSMKNNVSFLPPSLMVLWKGSRRLDAIPLKVQENKIAIDCESNSILIFRKLFQTHSEVTSAKSFPFLTMFSAHFEHEFKYLLIVGFVFSHNSIYFTLSFFETLQSALLTKLVNALN